ncbi:cytochrome P450 [Corynespora cassiicola Philippines]|uniref:Cytochrome P450 n=1 Tax=Corynespora cassiicola Philippines TaxID=1448308 RepID=A0A2T2P1J3_CORCC|nr:cytochrome P450 [Corynespora cassiicola Philippines]
MVRKTPIPISPIYGEQCKGVFQVVTPIGPQIVLPGRFADEIRNNPHLSFSDAAVEQFYGHLPGFDPFCEVSNSIAQEVITKKLTQSLNFITPDLAEEAGLALHDVLGESEDFSELFLKPKLFYFVARISSRVFSGIELCRNEEWLSLTPQYAIDVFMAARALRQWPRSLTDIVHWFLPETRKIRAQVKRARELLEPVVEKRRQNSAKAAKTADAIAWFDEVANGRLMDNVVNQLGLAWATIHTTTELVTHTMYDLIEHPEYIDRLREEIRKVVGEGGWKKSSLYSLKLMDSVLKETQRLHMPDFGNMARIARKKVPLSDGTVIPKGARIMVAHDRMRDSSIYKQPGQWVGDRFYQMRLTTGGETKGQLVTTSTDHTGFGHGLHACPGRFFAANESKVALCVLLMNYDWKIVGDSRPKDLFFGTELVANPEGRVLFKRRHDEILPL